MIIRRISIVAAVLLGSLTVSSISSADVPPPDAIGYWTPARISTAVPRDLRIDHRGLGYLRAPDGVLRPYGHAVPASETSIRPLQTSSGPAGAPSVTNAPVIESMSPASETTGTTVTFSARITSSNGVRSASALVGPVNGSLQRFSMSNTGSDVWEVTVSNFTPGEWNWRVEARDQSKRGGLTTVSGLVPFTVEGGGGGGGGGGDTSGARWTGGGPVQSAAGRILFTMGGSNYVCSGTTVTDGVTGRSIVLTAAHCIYDDVAKAFATNALFIPNQDDGGLDGTDWNCSNDPFGCWSLDHGVVDINWTNRIFPDNIPWDYGFYVVGDSGAD
ncbi:MAG: trypsin-like serine peptidase, partial [Ilumatobacteraceae bacterium]